MKKKLLAVALAATMVVSSAITALAVDVKDAISGDYTVTTFFNEKTDAVELKSGDSYTFEFTNTNNGTANYTNYVMAVTGAIGDAYTGADQEVVIIRADNWGWGGGMSDFGNPAGDDGKANPLVFETNIADDAGWAEFLAATQAGVACTVNVSRDGDTIVYDAAVGDYTFKTTATSGIALPESCYVFFTGESCTLAGFKTTKNSGGAAGNNETTAGNTTTNNDTTGATNGDNGSGETETQAPEGSESGEAGNSGSATGEGSEGTGTTGTTGSTTTGTTGTGTTGTGTTAPGAGDASTTAAVAMILVAAAGAVVVLKRKKVSE